MVLMAEKELEEYIIKYGKRENVDLPIFNDVALKIQMELLSKEPNIKFLSKLISSDQAIYAYLLKIANSVKYRGLVKIKTVKDAIARIGLRDVTIIIISDLLSNKSNSMNIESINMMKKLWQHSLGCAFAAGILSRRLDYGVMQNEAFFAGLFHDIGKLFILSVLSIRKKVDFDLGYSQESLLNVIDKLHADQGFMILSQYNIPRVYTLISLDHHLADYDKSRYLLVLVRFSNYICHYLGIGVKSDQSIDLLNTEEASILNITEVELDEVVIFLNNSKIIFNQ